MGDDLSAAAAGKPWSLMGAIFGLDRVRDAQGRPLVERRAPAELKEGVPMQMRPCPYDDQRHGRSMNVSALAQVTACLGPTFAEMATFRAALGTDPVTWNRIYTTVLGQLAQAALHVLDPAEKGAVPTRMSVSYKVSAGYVRPVRALLEKEVAGCAPNVTSENLLEHVISNAMLIGPGEVCAGPTNLIERGCRALIDEPSSNAEVPPRLLSVARLLSLQVRVGIAWEHFDRAEERALFTCDLADASVEPRTAYLRGLLSDRLDALRDADRLLPELALPNDLEEANAIRHVARQEQAKLASGIGALLTRNEGSVRVAPDTHSAVAGRMARYLAARSAFIQALEELERRIRAEAGVESAAPARLHGAIFPLPRALPWFERVIGYRLGAASRTRFELRGGERSVELSLD